MAPGQDLAGQPVELVTSRHPRAEDVDAYERVLGDAMAGDATLFAREDYVEEAWRIVDPVLKANTPVYEYEPGTWGPSEVDAKVLPNGGWDNHVRDQRAGLRWRSPGCLSRREDFSVCRSQSGFAKTDAKRRILILGGGFAGAYTALHLEKRLAGVPGVEIVLAAKENFVLFTPMLHEVAGGDVAVTDVVQPLRKMLRRTRVLIVDIESIDLAGKRVRLLQRDLAQAFDLPYDQLVLAIGAVPNFYRTPGIEEHAVTMKTLGDAILVRNRIIEALDIADNHPDEAERKAMLTVVVAGGGFAGVETAGAVNDLLREAIKFYPNLREDMLRVVLVHAGDVILPELSGSARALRPETTRPPRRGHSIEDRRHRLRR